MRRFALLVAGLALIAAVTATVSGCATQAQARWVIRDLGTLGGKDSGDYLSGGPVAINERGQIVGSSHTKKGASHAFLWANGKMRDLGTLGGSDSEAVAIKEHGHVIGSADKKNGSAHAFFWQGGKMRDLGTLGGPGSQAVAINERGQVVGSADTAAKDKDGYPIAHAFFWENGKMRDLGTFGGQASAATDINASGQVVGWSGVMRRYANGEPMAHAFLWQNGTMRDLGVLPGGKESMAVAINDQGQIAAYSYYTSFEGSTPGHNVDYATAFVWQKGRRILLPKQDSFPRAINERGEVIGEVYYQGGKQWMDDAGSGNWAQAFLWATGRQRILHQGETAWTQDINKAGQVVGLQYMEGMRACIWQGNGALVLLPALRGSHDSKAAAINDQAQIVGISGEQAVLWTLKR